MIEEYRTKQLAEAEEARRLEKLSKRTKIVREEVMVEDKTSRTTTRSGNSLAEGSRWRLAQNIVQANLQQWRVNQARAGKWKIVKTSVNWTNMLSMTELYVQRRLHHQGTGGRPSQLYFEGCYCYVINSSVHRLAPVKPFSGEILSTFNRLTDHCQAALFQMRMSCVDQHKQMLNVF